MRCYLDRWMNIFIAMHVINAFIVLYNKLNNNNDDDDKLTISNAS